MTVTILKGDCREVMRTLPDESVHCVVTSPPYFGLRDYGTATWDGGDSECDHSTPRSRGADIRPGDKQGTSAGSRPNTQTICACGARRIDSQIGLEPTPAAFVAELVAVFREVRRVLRADGTCWLNLGDSYNNRTKVRTTSHQPALNGFIDDNWAERAARGGVRMSRSDGGLKEKDLLGVPWMVAFALRADGWYLRQDIIWSKPNPMPESVRDRCTKAHEYIFLLSKSGRYYYDADAIAEAAARAGEFNNSTEQHPEYAMHRVIKVGETRNRRSVWEVATQPYSEAHFATFPPALIEPCILAGCPDKCCAKCGAPWVRLVERIAADVKSPASQYGNGAGRNDGGRSQLVGAQSITLGHSPSCACDAGTVAGTCLDPFGGAGTTGLVADRLGRNAILIELNPEYAVMAERRIRGDAPLFADVMYVGL